MSSHNGGHFKLDQNQIDKIRLLRQKDPEMWTLRALAKEFGTTYSNVGKIVNRRNRKLRIDIYRDGVSTERFHGEQS